MGHKDGQRPVRDAPEGAGVCELDRIRIRADAMAARFTEPMGLAISDSALAETPGACLAAQQNATCEQLDAAVSCLAHAYQDRDPEAFTVAQWRVGQLTAQALVLSSLSLMQLRHLSKKAQSPGTQCSEPSSMADASRKHVIDEMPAGHHRS